MELNIFFHHMLVGLWFQTYLIIIRTRLRVNGVPVGDHSGL